MTKDMINLTNLDKIDLGKFVRIHNLITLQTGVQLHTV